MTDDIEYRDYAKGAQPPYLTPNYKSTKVRSPNKPQYKLPRTLTEATGPVFTQDDVPADEWDLSTSATGETALGQLMFMDGVITDEDGRPMANTLIEIWQANAAGRYAHAVDTRDAPLDPNFTGAGRIVTGEDGHYRFKTIRPGAYPVPNYENYWRPPHIHISLFGRSFMSRMITQCYFPGDPLNDECHILQGIPEAVARDRLVMKFDPSVGVNGHALGYRLDLVLRGRRATPMVG
ncbi:MAG: protocatechuate 3,4-dioxygenase subunit beta [Alphaproteobacteria bacterium]|nr:protocatechuate 3,4-dioxygenase subunit beta [Alphaproteobacteria bacterium]